MSTQNLHRVEARYNIVSPEGGLRRQLRSYDTGARQSLDLTVETLDRQSFRLRVTPDRDNVYLDPVRDQVYVIDKGVAVFLDVNGEEMLDLPPVDVSLDINTEVSAAGMPAGTLTMFEIPIETKMGA